jgi:hypothetical protein
MHVNDTSMRSPRVANLRASKKTATVYAAAAKIRGLNTPSNQGVSAPLHPPRSMGRCNCRQRVNVVDTGHTSGFAFQRISPGRDGVRCRTD